jgi:hypothetical protein
LFVSMFVHSFSFLLFFLLLSIRSSRPIFLISLIFFFLLSSHFYPFLSSFGFPPSGLFSLLPVLFILFLTLPLCYLFHSVSLFYFTLFLHRFITLSFPSSIILFLHPFSFLFLSLLPSEISFLFSFFDSSFLASFSFSFSFLLPPSYLLHPFRFSNLFPNPSLYLVLHCPPFTVASDCRIFISSRLA